MTFKKIRRIACVAALASLTVAVPFMAGCVNSHPEAEITIGYGESEYVLRYKMYRKLYPQTVKHFIELADSGFYDGTIIHDFRTSYWYGGNYSYDEEYAAAYEGGKAELSDYMEAHSKEASYYELATNGTLTPTVYTDLIDGQYSQPLTTLIGEFSNNAHKYEDSASEMTRSFGCLATYYSSKPDSVKNKHVYLDKEGSELGVQGDYRYNCTTSLFSIQVSESTKSKDANYALFGMLQNEDVLTKLKKDVATSTQYTDVKLYVDSKDHFVSANVDEVEYKLRKEPIKIVSVKITKY